MSVTPLMPLTAGKSMQVTSQLLTPPASIRICLSQFHYLMHRNCNTTGRIEQAHASLLSAPWFGFAMQQLQTVSDLSAGCCKSREPINAHSKPVMLHFRTCLRQLPQSQMLVITCASQRIRFAFILGSCTGSMACTGRCTSGLGRAA